MICVLFYPGHDDGHNHHEVHREREGPGHCLQNTKEVAGGEPSGSGRTG